jgi:threonyl-tRNA synthetase
MRMLMIHADYLKYETKEKTKTAEEIGKEQMEGEFKEPLVVFISFERADEDAIDYVINSGVAEILGVADQIKPKSIVLYPYVHLLFGAKMGSAGAALKVLKGMETKLSKKFKVSRTPFGYYKSFELKCKGHPLSEFSRIISPGLEDKKESIEEKAQRIPSSFIVLMPDGKEHKLNIKDIAKIKMLDNYPLLKSLVYSEEVKGQPSKTPPSIEIMRKLELVDYESASEPGMFRYYPNGALIKDLLEKWVYKIAVEDIGAMKIDTPILYNWDEPDIREQAVSFQERDYRIEEPNKTLILRFAGDFGLFRMMKNTTFNYKQLPMRIYEISPSFRREKRGELTGLRRCSFFYMPDLHSFCKDLKQGKIEFEKTYNRYTDLLNGMEIDYALAFRIVEKEFKKLKPMLVRVLKYAKKPALIELLKEAKHYWICKSEHQAIDAVAGNAQLSTVQLDVEDSERYGIKYTDEDGKKKGCIIVHTSVGSIERLLYAVLETAAKSKKNPTLPLWLSPTQVRVIPLSEKHLKDAEKVMEDIEKENVRVDLDDREDPVPKKIRDAEMNWIPFTLVVGPKEVKSKKLNVRTRKTGKIEEMTMKQFLNIIKKETEDMPFEKLTVPKRVSKRPIFVPWGK